MSASLVALACSSSDDTTGAGGSAPSSSRAASTSAGGSHACPSEGWTSYGHDARRSFASSGCAKGALATAYRYTPSTPQEATTRVLHSLAMPNGAFVEWTSWWDDPNGHAGTTTIERIALDGKRIWTSPLDVDVSFGNWPAIAFDHVVAGDGLLRTLDLYGGVDDASELAFLFGQIASDASRLYLVNATNVTGAGLFVESQTQMGEVGLHANQLGSCPYDMADIAGGIAVVDSVVYYAPRYSSQIPMVPSQSGVYAFDGAASGRIWYVATQPASAISAGGTFLYLVEGDDSAGYSLVARLQASGEIAWSKPIAGLSPQAPAVGGSVVVVAEPGSGASNSRVLAFDATTGDLRWGREIPGAAIAPPWSAIQSQACSPGVTFALAQPTTIALALGTRTVVVTGDDGVHLIDLDTGAAAGEGILDGATGRPFNPVICGSDVYVTDRTSLFRLSPR